MRPQPQRDDQFKQLVDAVAKLALARPPPAMLPVRPPRQRRRASKPVQKPKIKKVEKPKPKPKPQQQKKKPNKKPGKRQRVCMKVEADCIFPVMLDGKVNGYACLVGDKVMKPAHVKGEIDNPVLAKLSFKRSTKFDLECAQIPVSMKSDAAKFTSEKPDGYYNWHHGAVQYSGGRFTIPTGSGRPGDSGRPIFDNQGRVVAIVLGGANEGDRTSLSVVTWNKNIVVKVTPEETVEWSATALMCVLGALTFPCSQPPCKPCCYDRQPEETLKMLELNADRAGYLDLLYSSLQCTGGRTKRSLNTALQTYRTTVPYLGRCMMCGKGSCHSPIAIEDVKGDATDGSLRIQVSAHLQLTKEQAFEETKLSYADGQEIKEAALSSLQVRTTDDCQVLAAAGHFIVAKCPEGDEIEVSFQTGKQRQLCRSRYVHRHSYLGDEKSIHPDHGGKIVQCSSYQEDPSSKERLTVHMPADQPDTSLLDVSGNNPVIKIHAGKKTKYQCKCKEGPKTAVVTSQTTVSGCTGYRCQAWLSNHAKWHYNSKYVPRSEEMAPKAYITVPYVLKNVTCRLSLVPKPMVTYYQSVVSLRINSPYSALLSVRSLQDESVRYNEWLQGPHTLNFTVPLSGLEYKWGNNEPQRLWAQHSTTWDAHGLPHSVAMYYYEKYPHMTIAVMLVLAVVITAGTAIALCIFCAARSRCLLPYTMTPNAKVPALIAFCCCFRRAAAETTAETLAHLWARNNTMFWIQLLIPIAAVIILVAVLKCMCGMCKQLCFLVLLGASVSAARAYEHTGTIPNKVGFPYRALVERAGYANLPVEIMVTTSSVLPTLDLQYVTCEYSTVVPSPYVKCCGTAECMVSQEADFKCTVFTGVYPLMWGGAYCFCDSENTQVSTAYIVKSPSCVYDHASAYRAHTAAVVAHVRVAYGQHNVTAKTYVNGESPIQVGDAKLILGPVSTPWSPFDSKIVVYRDKVYNKDFPAYGAGKSGVFGDIQLRTVESKDLYANTGLVLHRPSAGEIHAPYSQMPSGFKYWKDSKERALNEVAPFGCKIRVNPVRADDCEVGNIPFSIDIPDAAFTRVSEAPQLVSAECQPAGCTHSSDFDAVVTITYKATKAGSCELHSSSNIVTLQEGGVTISKQGSTVVRFSTAVAEPRFDITMCGMKVSCQAKCQPPKDHISLKPTLHSESGIAGISTAAWTWAGSAVGGTTVIIVGAILIFLFVVCLALTRE
ncbi:structural polyprotein [Harbor porpoise alphavirus]|nr:structural polyprotein [Harbor porpoise alphavirus]